MITAIIILSAVVLLLLAWVIGLSFRLNRLENGMYTLNNNQVIFQGDMEKVAKIIEHNAKVVNEIINIKNKVVMPYVGPVGEA
jgi:hypothetical protein